MAKSLHFAFMVTVLILLLVAAGPGIQIGAAKLCERRSTTWSGVCTDSNKCNDQCRNWEHATHGACHFQFPGFACFCYFNC
ncbi:defensin-like protein 1 [Nymphaea colorata]|nr:defensin-like protein 1 [Nymphaea colorata]